MKPAPAGPTTNSQTTARGRARREQLINVALAAFAAQGFRGASLSAIAQEVGISEPGLLHHFPTKKHLLLGVLEFHEARVRGLMQDVAARGGSFTDQLSEIARAHESDPAFIRLFTVLAAESVDPEHPAHEWFVDRYRDVHAFFREWVVRAQDEGRLRRELDPDRVVRLVVAVLDGLELQFLLEPSTDGISAPLGLFLEMLET
jgi:AcrR family transcriptional regulator